MKKWEMEVEEVEAVLEKIWDIHDKLSDAIHSISRSHFLNSTKSLKNKPHFNDPDLKNFNNNNNSGYVFVKEFEKDSSAISEAKSLNYIRSALEHLEDQLEFFHTVQVQQRAERDAALARLEQSRIILALRLAEHHGKKYKVLDEAMDFVGDVRDGSCFVGPENISNSHPSAPAEHCMQQTGVGSNLLIRVMLSGLSSAKKTLQLDKMGGIIGNAALFALSMLAMLHLHQVTYKNNDVLEIHLRQGGTGKNLSRLESSSSSGSHLDVRLARG